MKPDHRINDTSKACAEKYGGKRYLVKWDELPRCRNCERPMRPFRGDPLAWPATISRANSYACSSCYNGGYRKPENVAEDRKFGDEKSRSPKTRPKVAKVVAPPLPSRYQIAEHWSPEQHAAALQTAGHVQDVKAATRVMKMLGLFDDPLTFRHVANLGSNTGSFGR